MAWILVVAVGLAGSAALGGQHDKQLDSLFRRLQTTNDPLEAELVETLIWTIWQTYEGGKADVRLLMHHGDEALDLGDYKTAEAVFSQVVEMAPDFAEGWNRRATARYMKADYVGAIMDIQATLTIEPRHFGALSGLGLCYMELTEPEHALRAFQAALRVNPHLDDVRQSIEDLLEQIAGVPV